jgi:hypothetical protein
MKEIQSNHLHEWHQKAQGIVEYALILAFIVGIGAAIFANNGLADAVGKAYFDVSEAISNAINSSNEAKQQRMQDRLEAALKEAIQKGNIDMDAGQWIEIDVQQEKNKDGNYVDGGSSAAQNNQNNKVRANGHDYTNFKGLWGATTLKMYEMNIEQDSGWVGVRIVSNGGGSYTSYYYRGDATTVQNQNLNYRDTNAMNNATRNDGTKLLLGSNTWSK